MRTRTWIAAGVVAAGLAAAAVSILAPDPPPSPTVVWARRLPATAAATAGALPGLDFDTDDVRTTPGGEAAPGRWGTMVLAFGPGKKWVPGLSLGGESGLMQVVRQLLGLGPGWTQHYVGLPVSRLGPGGDDWFLVARYPFECPDGPERRALSGVWSVECEGSMTEIELRADGTVSRSGGTVVGVWRAGDGVVLLRDPGKESFTDLAVVAPDGRSFEGGRDRGVQGPMAVPVIGRKLR